MSTPPDDRPPPEQAPEQPEAGRKSASPLVWMLLLIALAAIAWYFVSQRKPAAVPVEPAAPAADTLGEDEAGAEPGESRAAPAAEGRAAPPPSPPADRAAEPLTRVQPGYPAAALRAREEGTVLLRVEVDAQGKPASVDIERSSRSRELDRAARSAVRQWTFSPAVENGRAVASTVTVPVDFRVEEQ